MIFDCDNEGDIERWQHYDILDVTRGVWLNGVPITYLDSDAGVYRVLLKDEDGFLIPDPDNREDVMREERRGRIQVTPKASE